ncbi:MAG: threonine--tRNA ligase [Puniceicoccales bacterium]|jgi:threonyl-tRNA synthetase|nr:threonine--tRNA ligase [Puniceicoccales bacterium]
MSEIDLQALRHSAAHILAAAVLRLFPDAKLDIGPATESGFYYDFDLGHKFTQEDLVAIENEMERIIGENQEFVRREVSRDEAKKFFEDRQQGYKVERLNDIPPDETVTLYTNGEFTDLCRGEHVQYSKQVKAVKLLNVAGAYYRGNEKNKQMQRIYGIAFPSKAELEACLLQLEEAKKRDHRQVGKELKLFMIDDEVGPGMVLWLPNGMVIRNELQNFILGALAKQGYQQVFTPHIAKLGLFRTSGHFPYYKESQFPPLPDRETLNGSIAQNKSAGEMFHELETGSGEGFLLKPMNCPAHVKIYSSEQRSYRDLPIRLAEFGTVYRWEQSGELNGMTRVRGFTQDDAHIFCRKDQLSGEINGCLRLVRLIFSTLGIVNFRVRIGLRDKSSGKYIGSDENWLASEEALRSAAKDLGVPFEEKEGEAAFYGPKIDFIVKDVIGREWQLGTVQVDYNLPERFDLSYTGDDNQKHRPIMIHRAPFGSLERFVGLLIEHFGGNFPTWLAPEQVRILTINDDLSNFALDLQNKLRESGIRCSIDDHSEKLGAKVRRAELDKVPHMFIVGEREAQLEHVSVRSRINGEFGGTLPIGEAISFLKRLIDAKTLPEKLSQEA